MSTSRIFGSRMLEVRNLTYRYGGSLTPALEGVSFDIFEGEICGFLAPNGGGKTTLFKILSTMLPFREGSISFNGVEYRQHYANVRSSIGVVFQNPSVDKKLTVRENLHCQAYLYGSTPAKERTHMNKLIHLFRLETYLDQKIENLSGGYRRRVELAKCMLHAPKLLLLDEPSTGLDIVSRRDMWQYLKRLREERTVTILLTTHLIEEAEQCDRVIILNKGRLVTSGRPNSLINQIGGEILFLKTTNTPELLALLERKWNIRGIPVDGMVRVELTHQNKQIIHALLSEGMDLVDSATISKPSLADVFFRHTGNQFTEHSGDVFP